jgi:hypothetical protein
LGLLIPAPTALPGFFVPGDRDIRPVRLAGINPASHDETGTAKGVGMLDLEIDKRGDTA